MPCTDFCRLAARVADAAVRLADWFSCPSPGAHLRLVPPANTWCVRQKASGYLHQLLYGLWRREVWTEEVFSPSCNNTWCVSYLHQLMYGLLRREAWNCSKGSVEKISKMGWSTYWLFWVHRCHLKLNGNWVTHIKSTKYKGGPKCLRKLLANKAALVNKC